MAAQFASWIDFEPTSLTKPARPVPPLHAPREPAPSAIELDRLSFDAVYTGPATPAAEAPSRPRTPAVEESSRPRTPSEMESSHPAHAVEAAQSLTSPPRNKYRFAMACVMFVQLGLNDSAPGALLPYLEAQYGVDYGTVSLVFVANAAGFVFAAFITNWLHMRFGRAKVLALGMLCTVVAYTMLVCTPPFAAIVVSFFLSGLGNALCLGLVNSFLANLVNATVLLGFVHASYGIGGILGPLIATALVGSGRRWSVFYFLTLALSVVNSLAAFVSFYGYEAESSSAESLVQSPEQQIQPHPEPAKATSQASLLQALKSRVVLLGAWFIFAYQGAEVTISGWVLSFLLTTRAHPPSQSVSLGYITSGFWAGITLGRIILAPPAQRIGEKTAVVGLILIATILQFVVWFVPNIIADAVAVAIVGLLMGPVYPCATVVFSRLLTKTQLVPALSIITALGSSGGAAGPFITGIIGQKAGAWVLNPIVVGLAGVMLVCWFGLPRATKRTE